MLESLTLVGCLIVIFGVIGFLINVSLLISYIRQRRQTNLPKLKPDKKLPPEVSQYFLFSTWLCFTINLILTIAHDGPTLIVGRPILGHTVSGVCGWFNRWMFYALAGHLILVTGNRYTILSTGSLKKHKVFGTKIGLRFATFIIWAPAATVATVVKLKLCECQFAAESLAYICIETIKDHYSGESSTKIKYDDVKMLLIIDSSILSFVYLFIIICIWKLFSSLKQRQMRVNQADSVLSMVERQKRKDMSRPDGKSVVMVNERNQIRQLIVSTFLYFSVTLCYLIIYWYAENKWFYFVNTLVQILYWSSCPTIYLALTNQIRNLIPCAKQLPDDISNTSLMSWPISITGGNGANVIHCNNEKSPFSQVYSSKTPSPIFSNASQTDSITFTSPMSLDVMNLYQYHEKRNRKPVLFSNEAINRSQTYQKGKTVENSRMTMIQARANNIEPPRKSPQNTLNKTKDRSSPFYEKLSRSRLPPIKLNAFERQTTSSETDSSPSGQILSETEKKRRRWLFMVAAGGTGSVDSSADSVSHLETIYDLRKRRQKQNETLSLHNCENNGSLLERLESFTSFYAAKNSTYQTTLAAVSESNCSSVCSVEEHDCQGKLYSVSAQVHQQSSPTCNKFFENEEYSTV